MLSIDLLYRRVQNLISKELGTGYMTPVTFNENIEQATVELVNKYAEILQSSTRTTEAILPFLKRSVLTVDATGKMLYPDDYVHYLAIRAFDPDELEAAVELCEETDTPVDYNKIAEIKVKLIDNDKLGDRLSSKVLRPDKYHPIASFYDFGAKIYPPDVGSVVFEYLREPVTAHWGYLVNTTTLLEEYDSATSTDSEFRWQMQNEVIMTVCKYFGVSVREQDLVADAQDLKDDQK